MGVAVRRARTLRRELVKLCASTWGSRRLGFGENRGNFRLPIFRLLSCIDPAFVLRLSDRSMSRTTLSPKFQVVIPKEVRKMLKLRPGTKFNVVEHEGRIELLPVRTAKEMRGFLRGIDTSVSRDKDRL